MPASGQHDANSGGGNQRFNIYHIHSGASFEIYTGSDCPAQTSSMNFHVQKSDHQSTQDSIVLASQADEFHSQSDELRRQSDELQQQADQLRQRSQGLRQAEDLLRRSDDHLRRAAELRRQSSILSRQSGSSMTNVSRRPKSADVSSISLVHRSSNGLIVKSI